MGDLFVINRADIFAVYPRIFETILDAEDTFHVKDGSSSASDIIILPTNSDYQDRIYSHLLAIQKAVNDSINIGIVPESNSANKIKEHWDPDFQTLVSPLSTPTSNASTKRKKCFIDNPANFIDTNIPIIWGLKDLVMASNLMNGDTAKVCSFSDEYETRRVYSMVYDVFRYKHILKQALLDVQFYQKYPELTNDQNRLWLLLLDLYLRHFSKRDPKDREMEQKLYHECYLEVLNDKIWHNRVYLAAAISRIRIKNNALTLAEMLPSHLQDEKVAKAIANPIVTGWINPCVVTMKQSANELFATNGFSESQDNEFGEVPLTRCAFKWDKLCPFFVSCFPSDRSEFSKSTMITSHQLIMQDRAFTVGPAIFSRLLDYFEIDGDIVQTHLSSPRSIAYLAALHRFNCRVNNIIVFGAGARINEYHEYMCTLGVDNIQIRPEHFNHTSIQSIHLGNVVGIFLTPSNSYSAVSDPIDLICNRGGDLSMLQLLTESEMSEVGEKRVSKILTQQRQSLRLAMSQPQVQFVLYETHSMLETENNVMVSTTVDDINKAALAHHIKCYKEKRRVELQQEQNDMDADQQYSGKTKSPKRDDLNRIDADSDSSSDEHESDSETFRLSNAQLGMSNADNEYCQVKVPKTDLFEIIDIPDMCLHQNKCLAAKSNGCYLSLIKRKKMTRLDAKQLIIMAENRKLFGDVKLRENRVRTGIKSMKKLESAKARKERPREKRSNNIEILIERLSQNTYSSSVRSMLRRNAPANSTSMCGMLVCDHDYLSKIKYRTWMDVEYPTYMESIEYKAQVAKLWWKELFAFLQAKCILNRKNCNRIFHDIKERKQESLKLTRALSPPGPIEISTTRKTYPLSIGYVDLDATKSHFFADNPKENFHE